MTHYLIFKKIDYVLRTLWAIGLAVAVWLIVVIVMTGFKEIKNVAPLIGAFAILISAGIASASVMKSIYVTKQNEMEKGEKEKERKRIFALNVMKTIQVSLGIFFNKAESNYKMAIGLRDADTQNDFDSDIQTTGKLLTSVFCESILPYLTEQEQDIISNFYSEYHRFIGTIEDDTAKENNNISVYNPQRRSTKSLHEYVKMFSQFAQSYIDLNIKKE